MKKLFLLGFAVGASVIVSAQRAYFLYLQTDDQAPFYVRMADKIYSSSTAGYLILPNLTDSTYLMGVGFPRDVQPETRFAVTINQNDKGYLLKKLSDGLSLFDVQNLSLVKPVAASGEAAVYETRTDKFSAVLSKAADDPGLLKVPVARKEAPKPEEKLAVTAKAEALPPKPAVEQANDSIVTKQLEERKADVVRKEEPVNTPPQPVANTDSVRTAVTEPEPVVQNTSQVIESRSLAIVRRSESSTTEGFGIVYLDRMLDRVDTVRILIPQSKYNIEPETQLTKADEMEQLRDTALVTPQVEKREIVAVDAANEVKVDPKIGAEKPSSLNSSCKETATDKDFMKLRKNMAAKSSDDEMISEAKKAFRSKCFEAEQLRYLSTLFLTAGAKYQFFDAAYAHVSDKENFIALQSEIKDEYYLKRFKALVGE